MLLLQWLRRGKGSCLVDVYVCMREIAIKKDGRPRDSGHFRGGGSKRALFNSGNET